MEEEFVPALHRLKQAQEPINKTDAQVYRVLILRNIPKLPDAAVSIAQLFIHALSNVVALFWKRKEVSASLPRTITLDETDQSCIDLLYLLVVALWQTFHSSGCLRADSKSAHDEIDETSELLLKLLRSMRALCEKNAVLYAVVGGWKLSSSDDLLQTLSKAERKTFSRHHTGCEAFAMLLEACNEFIHSFTTAFSLLKTETVAELCRLTGIGLTNSASPPFFYLIRERAFSLIYLLQQIDATCVSDEIIHALCYRLADPHTLISQKIHACAILLFDTKVRKCLAKAKSSKRAPDYLSAIRLTPVWRFMEKIRTISQQIPASELRVALFSYVLQDISLLCPANDGLLCVPVVEWSFAVTKRTNQIATFTASALSISDAHETIEILYGLIKSIRIGSGGVLSFRLMSAPVVHENYSTGKERSSSFRDPLVLSDEIDAVESTFTLTVQNNAIEQLKQSNFKKWVQSEQKQQTCLKNTFQTAFSVDWDLMDEPEAAPIRSTDRHTTENSAIHAVENQPSDVFPDDNISPIRESYGIHQFIASCTMASPLNETPRSVSLQLDCSECLGDSTRSDGNEQTSVVCVSDDVPLTPLVEHSTPAKSSDKDKDDSEVIKSLTEWSKSAPTHRKHEWIEEATYGKRSRKTLDGGRNPCEKPLVGIENPFQVPIPRESDSAGMKQFSHHIVRYEENSSKIPETSNSPNTKINSLLGEMHTALIEQLNARKAAAEQTVNETLHCVTRRLTEAKDRLAANRAALCTIAQRDISQVKDQNDTMRARMTSAIQKLNTQVAEIESASRSIQKSIHEVETETNGYVTEMERIEKDRMAAIEKEVEGSLKGLRTKVDGFMEANDPLALFSAYIARKGTV